MGIRMGGWTDKAISKRMVEEIEGYLDESVGGGMDEGMCVWLGGRVGWRDRWLGEGWAERWIEGWMDCWVKEKME